VVTLVITYRVNIPLNNELERAGPPDRIVDPAAVRERFEMTWVRWISSARCCARPHSAAYAGH